MFSSDTPHLVSRSIRSQVTTQVVYGRSIPSRTCLYASPALLIFDRNLTFVKKAAELHGAEINVVRKSGIDPNFTVTMLV